MQDKIREIIRENGDDPDEKLSRRMEEDDRDIGQLLDDARDSPGQRIHSQIESLFTTLEIVNKNHQKLTQSRDWYLEQGMELWDEDNREQMDAFQREYLRLLHNYSASVHSLIRHTYTILDRYEDEKPGLKQGYFEEISERDLGSKVDLLKQIRHYTQKRELPPIASSLRAEARGDGQGHETEFKLILNKSEMMDWDGWDSDVRDKLEEWDDEIEITELAEDYQRELNDFFEWFRTFALRMFYDEILDYVVTLALLEEDRERGQTE
ncbi:hypothetical protein [Halosimplex carlsbadense]|nr:hypothetical protein [Halosimplex carlsbadense]